MTFFKKLNKVESGVAKNNVWAGRVYIDTIPALREAVKKASIVYIGIQFGLSENEAKISKQEMLDFIKGFPDDATPHEYKMYGGSFGFMRGTTLHIG